MRAPLEPRTREGQSGDAHAAGGRHPRPLQVHAPLAPRIRDDLARMLEMAMPTPPAALEMRAQSLSVEKMPWGGEGRGVSMHREPLSPPALLRG